MKNEYESQTEKLYFEISSFQIESHLFFEEKFDSNNTQRDFMQIFI